MSSLYRLSWRHVYFVDSPCGTHGDAFAAQAAFIEVNVGDVVGDCDSLERTFFGAFAAAYARGIASFARHTAFVFVDAAYEYAAIFGAFLAKFNNATWARLDTSAACYTFCVVYYGQTGFGLHVNGIEFAGRHAIAATQTAVATVGLTSVEVMHDTA